MTDIKGSELPQVETNTLDPLVDIAFIVTGGVTSKIRLRDLVNWSAYDAGNNLQLGPDALASNETGIDNIAIGNGALKAGVTASGVIAIGHGAAEEVGAATDFIAIGTNAAKKTQASTVLAVGNQALASNTHGVFNLAVGHWSLQACTEGEWNTAVGNGAATGVTTGDSVTAIGAWTAQEITTQSAVTAVGHNALRACEQSYCTAVGTGALGNFVSSADGANDAIGAFSQWENTGGGGNVSIGSFSLYKNVTGAFNTALGGSSLWANVGGKFNTVAGMAALSDSEEGSYNVVFGANALTNARDTGGYTTEIFEGTGSITGNTLTVSAVTSGELELNAMVTAGAAIFWDTRIEAQLSGTPWGVGTYRVSKYQEVPERTIFGTRDNPDVARTWNNVVIGAPCCQEAESAQNLVAIGANVLLRHKRPDSCIAIGPGALLYNGGEENAVFGIYSAVGEDFPWPTEANPDPVNPNDGKHNTTFGHYNLSGLRAGDYNTCVGHSAGSSIVDTSNNTCIGRQALRDNEAWNNTAVGATAGLLATGSNNVLLGHQAGAAYGPAPDYTFLGLTSGGQNTFIGAETSPLAEDDTDSIVIGYQATGKGPYTATVGSSSVKAVALGGAVAVADLPSAVTMGAGARAFVTDANETAFLAAVTGGGANAVPVVSNGTIWIVG